MNLAYRWFCRLDLPDPVPNHSTFSKNRHWRFRESALLRHLFEKTVARCIADGLVSGQRLAADARKITREEHGNVRQVARDIAKTKQYVVSMRLRKKVEVLFAHLKRILGLAGAVLV